MFSVVDLPQPDGPSSTRNSLSAMSRFRSFQRDEAVGIALADAVELDSGHDAPSYP